MSAKVTSAKSVRYRNWFASAISRLTDPKDCKSGLIVAGLLLVLESFLSFGIIHNVPCMCMNYGDVAMHCWLLETEKKCLTASCWQRQPQIGD